jgi:single-strand DNA-binding protein
MSLPNVNGTARLIDDPQLRYGANGGAVVTVRLAFNSRKKDPQSGEWKDDATCFLDGKAFGQAAENLAETLSRGLEAVVSGRLKTEEWEKNGERKSKMVLLIDAIGPSLRSASAKVTKVGSGGGSGRQEFQQSRQQQGSGDPWGAAAQQAGQAGGSGWDEAPPF